MQPAAKQPENQANKTSATKSTFFGGLGGVPFFQAKLTVNQPGEKAEQETTLGLDRVSPPPSTSFLQNGNTAISVVSGIGNTGVQCAAAPAPTEEEEIQRKCADCEQEEQVQRMEAPEEMPETVQRAEAAVQSAPEKEEEIQRKCAECEQEEQVQRMETPEEMPEAVQRSEMPAPSAAPPTEEEEIQRKCADCEQEEQVQRMEAPEEMPEAVQRAEMPVPAAAPAEKEEEIQRKCADCEQEEEQVQRMEASEEMPETVQRAEAAQEAIPSPSANTDSIATSSPYSSASESSSDNGSTMASSVAPTTLNHPAGIQASLKVGAPDDRFEREADEMAEKVQRMPQKQWALPNNLGAGQADTVQRQEEDDPDIQGKIVQRAPALQRAENGSLTASPQFSSQLQTASAGTPLPDATRQHMEGAFNADFSSVRIHADTEASQLSSDIGARAFTHKNDIYFNSGEYNPSSSEGQFLLAHELTHTVQQGSSPAVQREPEAEAPQETSFWDSFKNGAEIVLREVLPEKIYNIYTKIKNGGIFGFIKETLFGLFKGLFNKLGFSDEQVLMIIQVFVTLKSKLPAIIEALKNGDCKPLFAALDVLSTVIGAIAGHVWDKLMAELEPIRLWLVDIWETFGAPVIEDIKKFAGEQWEMIKAFGRYIWDSFKPIRDKAMQAWDWVVKKLGFGDSDEPGLLGFISKKLSEAWDKIKEELKPVVEPINKIIGGIKAIVTLDAIKKLQEDAKKWLDEVVKTASAMGSDEDAVANKQLTLRQVLLPALNKSIDKLKVTIKSAGDWVLEKVNDIADNVSGFVTGLQENTYLKPVYSLVQKVPKAIDKLRDWALDKVQGLFDKIQTGVDHLKGFVKPLITLLEKLVSVAGNLLKYLPDLILGVPFMLMPACIKDPIKKWLVEVILKKIPIISEFIALTEKWEEIKTAALTIIKQVFLDGQLGKGLWTYFKTLLGILGIDPKLVTQIVAKAAQNFSDIISKPVDFLKNCWGAIKGGFSLFFENILIHLPKGALDWLFGEVKGAVEVAPPKDFTLGSIFSYVLDLFGITKENVYKRMSENPKIGPKKVATIRKMEKVLTGVLDWISVWVIEGPKGLLKKVKEQLGDLKDMIINGVVSWVTTNIVKQITKKLLTSSDPSGIGAIITTIMTVYDAVKAAIAYVNRMLNLVNSALDSMAKIIAGDIGEASAAFEKVLAKAVPVVIGFAVEALLGPVGDKIKEIVTSAREAIDKAIDWLINAALGAIESLVQLGKDAIDAIVEWWKASKDFKGADGQQHKLYLEGSESNAQLMVASKTILFSEFIKGIEVGDSDQKKSAKTNAIPIAAKIDEKKQSFYATKGMTKEEKKEAGQKYKKEMEDLLEALSVHVSILMDGKELPDGSYDKPIPIRWTKRGYIETLYNLSPIEERWTSRGMTPPAPISGANFKEKTKLEIPPTMSKEFGGKKGKDKDKDKERKETRDGQDTRYIIIGVDADNLPKIGKRIQRSKSNRGDGVKDRFRNSLLPNWNSSFKNTDYQIDHVKDYGWGGEDTISNLWPLYKELNNKYGNMVYKQVVNYTDEDGKAKVGTPSEDKFYGKYFIIEEIGDI